jgi:dihydrofolate synthase/folylpolyglutamate synthase
MEYLGETIEEIAAKKAGIIKTNHTTIVYPAQDAVMEVFERTCTEKSAQLIKLEDSAVEIKAMGLTGTSFSIRPLDTLGDINIKLLGRYGAYNAALAALACSKLRDKGFAISDKNIKDGLTAAKWAGRLEIVSRDPLVIIDGAHNPEGASALFNELSAYFAGYRLTFICGCMADKDAAALFAPFAKIAKRFITITPNTKRAMCGEELMARIKHFHDNIVFKNSIQEALDYTISTSADDEVICAFGSLYFMGGARDYFGLE